MSKEPIDFRFDERVADQYDVVRRHPPEVSEQIGRVIAREAGVGSLILEPGVGTGRIALPCVSAGCAVVGADLSREMLETARTAPAAAGRLHLVRCDLERLPFRPASFDAVLCVHVLHLLNDWRGVLMALLDSLRPRGIIVLGRDWIDPESFAGRIRKAFREAVVDLGETISAPPGARAFVDALVGNGAGARNGGAEVTAAEWQSLVSPRQLLDSIRSRDDAESWVLPAALLDRVMERLDNFAAATWPDIDEPLIVTRRFVYSVFERPAD